MPNPIGYLRSGIIYEGSPPEGGGCGCLICLIVFFWLVNVGQSCSNSVENLNDQVYSFSTKKAPVSVVVKVQPEKYLVEQNNVLYGVCNINTTQILTGGKNYYTNNSQRYEKLISPNLRLYILIPTSWSLESQFYGQAYVGRVHLVLQNIQDEKNPKPVADLVIGDDGKIYSASTPLPSSWLFHFEQYNVLMNDSQFGQTTVRLKCRGYYRGITVSFNQTEKVVNEYGTSKDWGTHFLLSCSAGVIQIDF